MNDRLSSRLAPLQARWKALAPREQSLLLAAAAVVGLAVLWWALMAPALQTLRTAPARHAELDAQLQRMHALQAEAMQLQTAPRVQSSDALRTLQTAVAQRLGPAAQINAAGDRATLTLKGAPADRLSDWLSQVRSTAHAVPVEMRLVRSAAAPVAASSGARPGAGAVPGAPAGLALSAADGAARWDGTVVLALPAQ